MPARSAHLLLQPPDDRIGRDAYLPLHPVGFHHPGVRARFPRLLLPVCSPFVHVQQPERDYLQLHASRYHQTHRNFQYHLYLSVGAGVCEHGSSGWYVFVFQDDFYDSCCPASYHLYLSVGAGVCEYGSSGWYVFVFQDHHDYPYRFLPHCLHLSFGAGV